MTSWASRRTLAADEVEVSGRVLGGTLQPGTPILRLEPTQHTCSFFPPSIFFVFIYLVVLGLSCSTWNLVPWTRIKLAPLNREYRVLATESLGKSPFFSFSFLAVLGLHCCTQDFYSGSRWVSHSVASLIVEHGPRHVDFSSCSSWALEHRLSSCGARA